VIAAFTAIVTVATVCRVKLSGRSATMTPTYEPPAEGTFVAWCAGWRLLDERGAPILATGGAPGGVGRGWFPLLDRLVADLVALGWDRQLRNVKEKYGGLSFTIVGGSPAMWAAIDQAEDESETICENCGADGYPRPGGWILALSDLCAARRRCVIEAAGK
jgi:hypothetical protein